LALDKSILSAARRGGAGSRSHIAEAAVQMIAADYEEFRREFDEVEAMTSDAIVHERC